MKEEELIAREQAEKDDLVTNEALMDAAVNVNPFTYDRINIDGVYHMEPNTLEVEVVVTRSPLQINTEKMFMTLHDVLHVNDLRFRCGGVDITDLADGTAKRYMIVSQFYP